MEKKRLETEITRVAENFLEASKEREIFLVSHFDTDGISSAAIMIQALRKLDKKFSIKILKNLNREFIQNLPKDKLILFLDLGSGNLNDFASSNLEKVFIIDHHEINQQIPENVEIINTELCEKQKISASGLTYLFCRELNKENKKFAKLAILGMIGDLLEREIDKLNHEILNEGEIKKKRGLLIYPATRPLNMALEFSSNPYIPGVTGNQKGVFELLREAELIQENGKCKSLLELTDEEMERLVTTIILKNPGTRSEEILGDIFLIKMFNKLEDARELSAKINACSRFGEPETAIQMCMEVPRAKKRADSIHIKYKQILLSGLKFAAETEKIKGEGFVLINAKDNIKDTIIGTIVSIISNSILYPKGTIIFAMAYDNENIKVSARSVGKEGRNIRQILSNVIETIGGEIGGHEFAAGCNFPREKEHEFINCLKKNFEVELVKI